MLDGGRGGTTADVEEVGGLAAVQLDDVHCCHGEAGAVDCVVGQLGGLFGRVGGRGICTETADVTV